MSVKPKFEIGETVWQATYGAEEKWVPCPDCLGQKYAKVTFADGSEVTVDCDGCRRGYGPSSGIVRTYEYQARVSRAGVVGMEIHSADGGASHQIRYSLTNHRFVDEDDLFALEASAWWRATELTAELAAAEAAKILRKDRPSDTWSRNASYHRKALKQAQHDVEYHTSKLNAAQAHVKEEKKA